MKAMTTNWAKLSASCMMLWLISLGCAGRSQALPRGSQSDRVILRMQEALPPELAKIVHSPASVRRLRDLDTTKLNERDVRLIVKSVLEQWDEVPLSSVSYPFLVGYIGLRAEGYDGGDFFAFQLFKGNEPSTMAIVVHKSPGSVLLLNDPNMNNIPE